MRSPVYRNIRAPLRILGFGPLELATLGCAYVIGNEVARAFGLDRVWVAVALLVIATSSFVFRRAFGDLFAPRIWRFVRLPGRIHPRLFVKRDAF